MATNLSIAVMAHPKRADLVPDVLAHLGDVPVVWDRHDNRWDTGRRALLAYDPQASHHLVVQDDAVLCRDFVAGAREAISHTPGDSPVCFYLGACRPRKNAVKLAVRQAHAKRMSWTLMSGPLWGQAIATPTSAIDEMVAWCDDLDIDNYDTRQTHWWRMKERLCWYTVPSLVDHRGVESLVPGRTVAGRFAHDFIGADESALSIDWTRRPAVRHGRR